MTNIEVSVIIPTFGRSENLIRAINSVLEQKSINFELIVVDDNEPLSQSRFETERLMQKFKSDNRVRYIQHEKNFNGSKARNTGVSYAVSDFIAFLDDDDEFYPLKLQSQVSHMKLNNCEFSYCLTQYYKSGALFDASKYCKSGILIYDTLISNIEFNTSSIVISKSAFLSVGGFDETLRRNQDLDLYSRLFLAGISVSCVPLVLLRVNVDSCLNQPIYEKYLEIRLDFMDRITSKVNFTEVELKNIYYIFNLDLAYYALKRGKFNFFYNHIIKVRFTKDVVLFLTNKSKRILSSYF